MLLHIQWERKKGEGGEGGMRFGRHCAGSGIWRSESADAKVAFFAYHMQQCISAVKLITLILNICILGSFHAQQNRLLLGLRFCDKFFFKKSSFVFGFRPQLLALGG